MSVALPTIAMEGRAAGEEQEEEKEEEEALLMERETLCLSGAAPHFTLHRGDDGFVDSIRRHYSVHESNVAEKLVKLKLGLATLPTDKFWTVLMEGITDLIGAQYAFATKRILADDTNSAVEMPAVGEPGSCLMAVAIYYNDGGDNEAHVRDHQYLAYGGPCAHMKHDKVFFIPERLAEFTGERAREFAFPVESYLGVPLFSRGKCLGHLGAFWSKEGLARRRLSWSLIEMVLHALEDMTVERILQGEAFRHHPLRRRSSSSSNSNSNSNSNNGEVEKLAVIPAAAITAAQSLKPYARSLSHELRTPMQGVVGMLDIMHATVQDALESAPSEEMASVFRTLRDSIEMVQDSSGRAVEAADNVVQAYDMNMRVPDTPGPSTEDEMLASFEAGRDASPSSKRKRVEVSGQGATDGRGPKQRVLGRTLASPRSPTPSVSALGFATDGSDRPRLGVPSRSDPSAGQASLSPSPSPSASLPPGPKVTKVRQVLHIAVNECLRYGGRPDSAVAEVTDRGEIIEVRSRSSDGNASTKWVEWTVDRAVPEDVQVDERDFAKLISVLLLNAIKFTSQGRIALHVRLSPRSQYVVVSVTDTGTGIPEAFLPNLFKAFSRQDDSITRQREGLGLGLLVAKGLVRRIGGDLICVRSDTQGPNRGSEFELTLPVVPPKAAFGPAGPSAHAPTPADSGWRSPGAPSSPRRGPRTGGAGPETPRRWNRAPTKRASSPASAAVLAPCPPTSSPGRAGAPSRRKAGTTTATVGFDCELAQKHPLRFMVVEDNRINRKLLVAMLSKLGYSAVHEAFDGAEAVRLMEAMNSERPEEEQAEEGGEGGGGGEDREAAEAQEKKEGSQVDVILMDLWMPNMDGYEAAERILAMGRRGKRKLKILAVTADITDDALERAKEVGMQGHMAKPYKLMDLERLITDYCSLSISSPSPPSLALSSSSSPSSPSSL